jgi:hypothetical protein
MYEKKQLFDFMMGRIQEVGREFGLKEPQAFARWFCGMYFLDARKILTTDGGGDGKVDLTFQVADNRGVEDYVINSKFTTKYDAITPVSFYNEITSFWRAFANKGTRKQYLQSIRSELRGHYKRLLEGYDNGKTNLIFITNHRRNDVQFEAVKSYQVRVFHLEDVTQFMVDHIEDAMPRTAPLLLTGISHVLSPDRQDTSVPTSIVFARLIDFLKYMDDDQLDLLFARNVRVSLGDTEVNKQICKTFDEQPGEFAFSNNGITMLCERHRHDPGSKELNIENPRIVNGAQTLHTIRGVENPSKTARVMVRIIEIPPPNTTDLAAEVQRRKEIINKISIRSNMQNPIKRWNLIANDDFQHELGRFFRKKKLFYERRDKEWKLRKAELRSVGIQRGPGIKGLTQLIASYYFENRQLGPANAKSSVGDLFEDKPYKAIRQASCEIAYQCFLLQAIISKSFRQLSESKQYVRNLEGHADLSLFALCVRVLKSAAFRWGRSEASEFLETASTDVSTEWIRLAEHLLKLIHQRYRSEAKRYLRNAGKELTLNNFFKSQKHVNGFINLPIPRFATALARRVVEVV